MPLPPVTNLPPWAYNDTSLPPWLRTQPRQIPPQRPPVVSQNIPPPMTRTAPRPTPMPITGAARGGVGGKQWVPAPTQAAAPAPTQPQLPVAPPMDHNYDSIMQQLVQSSQGAGNRGTSDYNDIMSRLTGMLNQKPSEFTPYTPEMETFDFSGPTDSTYTPYNPTDQAYERTPEFASAYGRMEGLADTGGYSEADLTNLRARGISPIRSIYANAMQSLDRNKALQGGYSPGHTAATTRMSRDLSEQIGGATTNVNAKIAEMVAQGKQAAIPQLLAAAAQENAAKNAMSSQNTDARNRAGEVNAQGMFESDKTNKNRLMELLNQKQGVAGRNTDAKNKASEFNSKMKLDTDTSNKQRDLEIMSQMRSLYGTTPALADTFSKNALSTAELATKLKQLKQSGQLSERELEQKGGLGLIDAFIRARGQK